MRAFTFRGYGAGAGPDVLDRQLRVTDLPVPMTNAEADRTSRDQMIAHQRGLLRLSGFGEGEVVDSGDAVAASGASSAGFALGSGASMGRAVLLGVGVTVGSVIALRLIDRLWGKR